MSLAAGADIANDQEWRGHAKVSTTCDLESSQDLVDDSPVFNAGS
jgi:hypothetical protein